MAVRRRSARARGRYLTVSFPTRFISSWVETHYKDAMLECAAIELPGLSEVTIVASKPAGPATRGHAWEAMQQQV